MKQLNILPNKTVTATALCAALYPLAATAQLALPVEPEIRTGDQALQLPQSPLNLNSDATPIGVTLTGMQIINLRGGPSNPNFSGAVDLSAAGAKLQNARLKGILHRYIGAPMSPQLLSQIQAEITEFYRSVDRPLVAVNLPPQDITEGRLIVEVIPFRVGQVVFEGNTRTETAYIDRSIRTQVNDEVDSAQLTADLNWLNLNPYRNAGALFEPGGNFGETDLIIRSQEQRPWQIYAGLNTAVASSAESFRAFAGVNTAQLPVQDMQLSYQFTADNQSLSAGKIFGLGDATGYQSHSAILFAPLETAGGHRGKLRFSASTARSSRALTAPFTQRSATNAFSFEYAGVTGRGTTGIAEVFGAINLTQQENNIFFNTVSVSRTRVDLARVTLGARGAFQTPFSAAGRGQGDFELRLTTSPGGVTANNTSALLQAAENNPAISARYSYVRGRAQHSADLGAGVRLTNALSFQFAQDHLPGSDKFSLGGQDTVRGYYEGEVTGDLGAALQTTLRLPETLLGDLGSKFNAAPSVFYDIGSARNQGGASRVLSSVGIGIDVFARQGQSSSLSASASLSRVIQAGPQTAAGSNRVNLSMTLSF